MAKNVIQSAARDLQDLSLVFRKSQSQYLKRGWFCPCALRVWPPQQRSRLPQLNANQIWEICRSTCRRLCVLRATLLWKTW